MKIFFSVGEPSGDLHGANLIQALKARRPGLRFVGYGGPRMARAGCELHEDLTQLAVMWLLRVLLNLHKFWGLLRRADAYFEAERPDAVVLIDYPGFNWHIARKAKARGIPVIYYGAPQLWGWASWRVRKMRRDVDHVLCKLPFEEDWYQQRGCNATYVGHPYFDELKRQHVDHDFIAERRQLPGPLLTLLPGSRTQEVKNNLPDQLAAAARVLQRVPGCRVAVASYKESQAELARRMVAQSGLPAEVHVGRTPELISAATCCLAVSGSVSLELLYHAKPTVILYRVSRFAFWVQSFFRRVRYITLVNLLTAPELFPRRVGVYDERDPRDAHALMPEHLTCVDRTDEIAHRLVAWLTDADERDALVKRMEALRARVAKGGASQRGADYIAAVLDVEALSAAA